jgi:DNA replication initiation complex subunit (GINS family)
MYDVLYAAWLKEKENKELQKLSKDFYAKAAEYIGNIRQEGRMLDQKSAKAKLISQELSNAKRLMEELVELRFKKIVDQATSGKPVKKEALTVEEEKILLGMKPSLENFQSFLKNSLRGKISKIEKEAKASKKMLLRFVKEVPAIVGADLKIYGPFSVEDVATLPAENAKVLVKHGAAMEIETG